MILQYLIVFFIFFIWITSNERTQRSLIYVEYFSCNSFAFYEIFFQKFLRFFHCDDDENDDIHDFNSKKRFVLIRKKDW